MKLKTLLPVFALVVLMTLPSIGMARLVHDIACDSCHKPGANLDSVASNICIGCHTPANSGASFPLVRSGPGFTNTIGIHTFLSGDASNARGALTAQGVTPGDQTSHNWAASDTNPAAGASAPSNPLFYGTSNYAGATVSCARCHDPHGAQTADARNAANPKLLKLGQGSADAMCIDCHKAWDTTNANAYLTHPLVKDYPTFQSSHTDKYKPFTPNGAMALEGGLNIVCSTCHGTHYSDSNATTTDGAGQAINVGDGYMLKGNGRLVDPSGICNSCHIYKNHGTAQVGCIDCHSGHSYNSGTPNFFVLRNNVSLATWPVNPPANPGTNLLYTSANYSWRNAGNGYCEGCHTLPVGDHNGAALTGDAAACSICHKHYDATKPNDPAFAPAGGCNTCHGYPPVQTIAGGPNGYAVDGPINYSTDPNYKLEANTAHAKHAGGTVPQYLFSCSDCHAGNTHDSGTFQDVFNSPNTFVTAGGTLVPGYNKAGNGTCSTVYCHSNGGARAAAPVAATVPAWVGGATTCSSCHGNNAATMTASGNSATHQKHLAQGYSCALCHKDTAANATTLAAGAIQGKHVNGSADVVFDGSALTQLNGVAGAYNANGTCQTVYCHSNGANVAAAVTPDWDVPTTVVCGSCHNVTGQNLSAAHSKHVFDTDGPQLGCTTCHTNNGSGADHVDGFPSMVASLQTAVCNTCHGVDGAETVPVWTVPTSSDCVTCHSGSLLSTIGTQAPDRNFALIKGHNLASGSYAVSNNPAANKTCEDCHDKAATHLTGTGNLRLKVGFSCATCHSTITTHQAKTCITCHDPHGNNNIYMVKTTSAGNFSGTVAFTKKTGTNSYDEADASNGDDICATCHTATLHNRADATGVAHNEGNVCIPCHLPHTNPGNAFAIGAGTSCDGCHGFPPATAAHASHNITSGNTSAEDRTDCAACHTGADLYTYSGTGDQPGLNHGNAAGRLTILATSVGYNSTNNNCTNACHTATVANNGVWRPVAPGPLACDACHYYSATPTAAGNAAAGTKALTGTHDQHFTAGKVCIDCHAPVTDLTHNTVALTGTDLAKIQGLAVATQDEATVLGTVGTDVDPGNSVCNNAACHNPSGTTYSATWNGPAATCDLCHSSTDPATSNHSAHLNSAATFGVTIACTDCHADNGVNMAHLNGTVDLTGTKVLGYVAPNCTNDCHQDGRNGVAAVTATWGMPAQANCTLCHVQQPATGSHTKHLAASATCADCHDNTVDNTTAAVQHLDLNIDAFDNISGDLGYPQNKALNTAFTNCTSATNCHTDGRNAAAVTTPNWGTAASCTECHTLPMVTGSHSRHLTTSITAIACTACHAAGTNPATDSQPSAGHRDGNVDNNVALQYGVTPFTDKIIGSAFTTCAAASCHDNGLGVVVATPVWGTAVTDCSQCHLKRPTTAKHSIHLGHTSIAIPAIGCGDCHTGAVEGTTLPTTGHYDGNIDVANGYPPNVAKGSSTWTGTCSTAVCHTNAQSGNTDSGTTGPSVVTTPAWNSTATCGACHAAVPTSAKHSAHLGPYGAQCSSCHATAGNGSAMPTANHLNNSIDVGASAIYSAGGVPGNGWGTCTNSVAGCHPGQTRPWDATGPSCNSCHGLSSAGTGEPLVAGDMLSTNPLGQHNTHVNGAGLGCAVCHTGGHNLTSGVTGQDDTLQISFTGLATGGTYNPPAQWTAGKWLYSQTSTNARQDCSNLYCHSSGQSANGASAVPTYATPDWGNIATGQCGTCHLGDGVSGNATTIATGSHTKHIADGAICNTCHAGNTHVNQLIDVTSGTYTAAGAPGNGYGTCSTATCHENGASAPAVLVTTPTWGTAVTNCTECHAGSAIASGSHTIHLSTGASCTSCHASGTNPATETAPSAGHRNGSIDTLVGLGYGNSTKGGVYSTCATANCHVTNRNPAGLTPVWGVTPAITNCTECHTTPPTGDTHLTHINANTNGQTGLTIGCTDCHDAATNVATQTVPATGHRNGSINAAGGYPAKLITDATYKSCNAALCHQTGQAPASYVTTSNFNINDANCTQCHTNAGLSLSHPKHIATNDCSACHTGATKDTSYSLAAHGDGNVDVAVGGYTANKTYGAAKESCAAISCHSDGLSGAAGSTPVWGSAAVGCAACHNDNLTVPTQLVTGSHDEHLQSLIMAGIVCADCHTGANPSTGTPSATHANGTVEAIGYATANAAIGQGSWTTCSNVSCHDNGTGVKVTTPTWSNTTITNCSECHANAPTTNAHGTHLAISGVNCGTCHTGAVQGSNPGANHLNGLVDVLFGYTDTTKGAPYGTCGTASCHNNGLGVNVASPLWNQTSNCNTCHTTPPATGSHSIHLTNTEAGAISCGNCHSNATTTTTATGIHANNNVDVFDVTSGDLGYPATRALGSATWTTCNAASCHDNGTGTLVTTPNWGTSAACTECHTTVPATAAHSAHLNNTITSAITCTTCHAGAVWGSTTPTTGHRDGNLDVTGGFGYPANVAKGGAPYDSCTTTYCHGNAMPRSTVSGTTNAPNWGATSTGCTFCHAMPPTAIPAHGSVTLATQCKNCHANVNAAGNGFINNNLHINGTLEVTGGDNCNDCHSNIGSGLSGAHSRHVTTPYVGKLSTNDYGNNANGWNRYTNTGGVYDIGCGFCHPSTVAGHQTKQTSLSPTDPNAGLLKVKNSPTANYNVTAAGKCSAVYCHSDGTAANLTAGRSLDWFAPASTNKCNECHTNSPTSNAHSVHTVGIHYTDLYDSSRTGIMAITEAHGSAAMATTITCTICHGSTVNLTGNDKNDVCSACHGTSSVKGDLGIATGSTTHLNGVKDVAINLTGFKSKAQLRDDITQVTELNGSWTRTNGYKQAIGTSYDQSKTAGGFTAGTCSAIACHNGNSATWTDPVAGNCQKCHTTVPK